MILVDQADWMSKVTTTVDQTRWLAALDSDIQSAQVEFSLCMAACIEARDSADEQLPPVNARILHHAKAFVSAMRRVARVLEAANLSAFPPEVSNVIKEQWRRKKFLLDQYTDPRNGIEHHAEDVRTSPGEADIVGYIQNVATGTVHLVFEDIGLEPGHLTVGAFRAPVSLQSLESVLAARAAIVEEVVQQLPARRNDSIFSIVRYRFPE